MANNLTKIKVASKVIAIQIIIVDCDSFVIQSTMNNLWRKNQEKAEEQAAWQYQKGSEEAIQVVIIDCDLFVIQSMMIICGKHHGQSQQQHKTGKVKAIQVIVVDCDFFVIQSTRKNLWQ